MVRQAWRHVTFLHWPVRAETIARLLPRSLDVDTFDGSAWVTLTPFSTTCEIGGVAPAPGDRRFPETNVRTYVRGPDGDDGLFFLSLDVTNRANSALGRALLLPYYLADMTIDDDGDITYTGRRRGTPSAAYDITVRPGHPQASDPLAEFLTGRWSAYVPWSRLVVRHDVEHEPWPLQAAVAECRETMLASAGVPHSSSPPLVHYSPGVDARLRPARLIYASPPR
jgi:uncharacterized protein